METILKEVILEGFKSFRDRTSIKFDGPLTAVVGPNGSGKSNVVDAIKWVLGDPSPRSIRAATGLEAIYRPVNGNGDGSGFASIIIKIDNSNPGNPDEPAEWEIERRYYRSGESIYTVNGKTARLKDVRALMAQKGFGLGSLSVVGQGEIDGFLSLVPTDRRLVFEDLARISDFKANKRKILGRLDDCARNDERLRDLLGEISIRVDVLTVQAEAARRHADLSGQASDIRAQLAAQEYILAQRNVERHEKRLEELREDLVKAKNLKDETQVELIKSRQALEDARSENASILAGCEEERRRLDHARAEERRLVEANQHLSTLIGTLEDELKDRKTRINRLKGRQNELRGTAENARIEKEDASRSRLDHENFLSKRWGYYRSCERERERLAARVERLQGEVSFFARDAEFHTRRAEALSAEAEKLEVRRKELNSETETVTKELSGLNVTSEDLAAEKSEHNLTLTDVNFKLATSRTRRHNLTEKKRETETEIKSLEKEKHLLAELEASREGYAEGVKAILDRRTEFPGLHGTLGELITVKSGYEKIIQGALGDSIGYLVVDTLDQALSIIKTVRSESRGTVTCIIREFVPASLRDVISNDLISYCSTIEKFIPILKVLLNGSIEKGAIADLNPDCFTRMIVTSDGTIFSPPAMVSGGSESTPAKGILTRRARLDEIEAVLLNRNGEAESLISDINILSSEIESLEKQLTELEKLVDELGLKISSNADLKRRKNDHLEKIASEIRTLDKKIIEICGERDGCVEIARLAKLGTEAVRRIRSDAETDLERIEKSLPSISPQVDDLRSRLQRYMVLEASYREEADRAEAEIERLAGEIDSVISEGEEKEKRLDEVREQARGISVEYDNAVDLVKNLELLLPDLEKREKEAGARIDEMRIRVDEMETAIEDARGGVERAETALHSQDVKLAEVRGGLQSLEKGLDEYPEFAVRIRSGELSGKDIPSKKELTEKLEQINLELDELGEVNPLAIQEEETTRNRRDELHREREDLIKAEEDLRKALEEVERQSEKAFMSTFRETKAKFSTVFANLFPGGSAELSLTDPTDPLESGIDVKVKFPGKGELDLLQFSGGERSLIALALLFAILMVKPSSFTLLDEVEAALDDVNTAKFLDYLTKEFKDRQFILITHNKITMERADRLYGVTMRGEGISQIVSVDLKRLQNESVEEVLGHA